MIFFKTQQIYTSVYFTVGEFFWKQNQIIQTECLSKILTDGFGSTAHFRSANIFLEDLTRKSIPCQY